MHSDDFSCSVTNTEIGVGGTEKIRVTFKPRHNLAYNSELIIVNDGSTDNSLSIINKFLKTYPNINSKIINQENTGPSRAINKALKYVKYSHIKMVDGDDILAPNVTAFMFSEMIRLNLDLLYGHWVWDENHFNYKSAIFVGILQVFSLIPGVSRSGITISAARLLKFNRYDSTKISFLLSIPTLAAVSFFGIKNFDIQPFKFFGK